MTTTPRDSKRADGFIVTVLCLGALAYGVFGVKWLVDPTGMATPLGITLNNGDATSDARAVYGGMELGLAAFLAFCATARSRRTLGLVAAVFSLLGLGCSRLIGILLVDSAVTGGTWQLLGTDFGGATLCAVAFFVSRKND